MMTNAACAGACFADDPTIRWPIKSGGEAAAFTRTQIHLFHMESNPSKIKKKKKKRPEMTLCALAIAHSSSEGFLRPWLGRSPSGFGCRIDRAGTEGSANKGEEGGASLQHEGTAALSSLRLCRSFVLGCAVRDEEK